MRHEYKHHINYQDYLVIRERLLHLTKPDSHIGEDGTYRVRSLYFDNQDDKALREKTDGINCRDKFRIRYYNDDFDFIRLEKKSKRNSLCDKQSAPITREETCRLCHGDTAFMRDNDSMLMQELYVRMKFELLRPRVIVDYKREPYIYAPGNVRVTFDSDIRTGLYENKLFEGALLTAPTQPDTIIMEVKYDAFLPEIIQMAVTVPCRRAEAFSKYALGRMYG